MKALEKFFDSQKHKFEKGGKLEKFYVLYEAIDTFVFTPSDVTKSNSHVRDSIDFKRAMIMVAWALLPCVFMAMYNTGYQANLVLEQGAASFTPEGWRAWIMNASFGLSSASFMSNLVYGALFFLPVYIVTMAAGGIWEAIFAGVRGHEINEGFVVSGLLFPLTLPPTIPLWQVAVGISFGVVIGKEVFGGTGKNILNPALTARVFLFFAYPAQISGDKVWTAVDGFSGATALSQVASGGMDALKYSWNELFMGFVPGSMGETSTLACLIGAAVLIYSGIGSWRTILACFLGMLGMTFILNMFSSDTNMMFAIPWHYQMVLGSFAFAAVFMATDPVSSAMTNTGRFVYGFFIGILGVLIRSVNPAYPEGWMLAILFMNVFAPLIDYFVVNANIKRREARS